MPVRRNTPEEVWALLRSQLRRLPRRVAEDLNDAVPEGAPLAEAIRQCLQAWVRELIKLDPADFGEVAREHQRIAANYH